MKRLSIQICVLIIIVPFITFSQEKEIEELLEEETEYSDQSELLERLIELRTNPVNLNTSSVDELIQLPWIPTLLANRIVQYRAEISEFRDITELLNIEGVDQELLNTIREYIAIDRVRVPKRITFQQRSRLGRKVDNSAGVKNGYYYNSPNKYYNRINLGYGENYELGLLFEKDSGERNLNDLALYYLKYQNTSGRNKLIFGNYRLEFGQGLTFWNPYSYGKGSNPVYSAMKRERGLSGYQMVDENASLFGVASQICLKIYQLLIFYSDSKLDASLNSSGFISSIYNTGYHRNENESSKKDMLQEKLYGGRLSVLPSNNLKFGITYYQSSYDKSIYSDDLIRNANAFRGNANYVVSADFNVLWKNIKVFGEFANCKSGSNGTIVGANISFKDINFIMLYRNYADNFHSLHVAAFGDKRGAAENEHGFYSGIRYRIATGSVLSFYYDVFKSPWRTYTEPLPVSATDFLIQFEQKISRDLRFAVRFKQKKKYANYESSDLYGKYNRIFEQKNKKSLRLQIEYWPISVLKLRGRFEQTDFRFQNSSKGMLIYQDIKYRPRPNLTMYSRLTIFDTADYDSRVYQFENDVPFVLTNQMLYGKGSRWYICLVYKLFSNIRLGVKYSITYYENEQKIGSGNDSIAGDSVRLLNLQLETRF